MSQEIYDKARELIKARKFEEARKVLQPIAYEARATAWLTKINEVSPPVSKTATPPQPPPRTISKSEPVVVQKKSQLGLGLVIGLLLGLVGGIAVGAFLFAEKEQPTQEKLVIVTATLLPATPTLAITDTPTVTPTPEIVATNTRISAANNIPATPVRTARPTQEICGIADWWYNEVDPILSEFFDTAELAASTSRIGLAPLVLELQRLGRDYDNLDYPSCAEDIRFEVWLGINEAIDGFVAFAGNDEIMTEVNFTVSNRALYDAWYMLLGNTVAGDSRMAMTSFIWGGDQPEGTSTPTPSP